MSKLLCAHVDLDGLSIVVLEKVFHEHLGFDRVLALEYDFEKDPALTGVIESFDEIVMADISSSEEYFLRLTRDLKKKVTVYDHHASSSYLDDYRGNVHDEERCGTRIFFEEYVLPCRRRLPEVVFAFVDRVDAYDRWQVESPLWEEALSLNRVLYGVMDYGQKEDVLKSADPFIRIQHRKLTERSDWGWTPTEVQVIDRAREAEDKRYGEARRTLQERVDYRGARFGMFALPGKISIVCHRLLSGEEFKHLDYVLVANTYGGLNGNLSARSKNGFDCTRLGPMNGHLAAAGGAVDPTQARVLREQETCLMYKDDPRWAAENAAPVIACDGREI